MSKEDNRKMISAYEKMLADGTAFREVDLTMHDQPDVGQASGAINESPLGDQVPNKDTTVDSSPDDGYGEFDSVMEQRMDALRRKASGSSGGKNPPQNGISGLRKRIEKLEEALLLVMETQTKLIEG